MKITDELKSKIEAAQNKEELKDILANSELELTDEEIESVAGGASSVVCRTCFGKGKVNDKACVRCGGTGNVSIVPMSSMPRFWIP